MPRGPQETHLPVSSEPAGEPTAEAVAAYLKRHPRFLHDHPQLIDSLTLPTGAEGRIVDLRAALIERLRAEVARLNQRNDELVVTSRGNLNVQARVHEATVALLGAETFEQLIERATNDLAVVLDVDVVALGVEQRAETLPPIRLGGVFQLEPGTVERLIGRGRQVELRSDVGGDPRLYGAGAGLVRSDALVRLTISPATPPALLAFGARTAGHFHPGQGTELLLFLGRVLGELIRAWLALPE